jgi:hypothetical protein
MQCAAPRGGQATAIAHLPNEFQGFAMTGLGFELAPLTLVPPMAD